MANDVEGAERVFRISETDMSEIYNVLCRANAQAHVLEILATDNGLDRINKAALAVLVESIEQDIKEVRMWFVNVGAPASKHKSLAPGRERGTGREMPPE